jgi:hypothetical protein
MFDTTPSPRLGPPPPRNGGCGGSTAGVQPVAEPVDASGFAVLAPSPAAATSAGESLVESLSWKLWQEEIGHRQQRAAGQATFVQMRSQLPRRRLHDEEEDDEDEGAQGQAAQKVPEPELGHQRAEARSARAAPSVFAQLAAGAGAAPACQITPSHRSTGDRLYAEFEAQLQTHPAEPRPLALTVQDDRTEGTSVTGPLEPEGGSEAWFAAGRAAIARSPGGPSGATTKQLLPAARRGRRPARRRRRHPPAGDSQISPSTPSGRARWVHRLHREEGCHAITPTPYYRLTSP